MSDAAELHTAAMQVRNFDFLAGAWRATERWLSRCGQASDDWRERPAFLVLRPLLGGMANAEEITYPDNPEFAIATFRCYEIASAEWAALRGRFNDGCGEFLGESEYEGRAVRVKYIWKDVTAISARWERWFSFDEEKTWELNVVWALTRERSLA